MDEDEYVKNNPCIPAFSVTLNKDTEGNNYYSKSQRSRGQYVYTAVVNVPSFSFKLVEHLTKLFMEKNLNMFCDFNSTINLTRDMFKVSTYSMADHITKYLELDYLSVYIDSVTQSEDFYRKEAMLNYDELFSKD
jgi:hypothetical protein